MSRDVRFARIREEEYLFLLAVLCPPSVFPTIFLWFAGNEKLWRTVVKEICPRGNNKVIIYFLIS